MFQYLDTTLTLKASWLYDETGIVTYSNYQKMCTRGKITRVNRGGGLGNGALVKYDSLPTHIKAQIEHIVGGDPHEIYKQNEFKDYLEYDTDAFRFFSTFFVEDKKGLPPARVSEYTANATVFLGISKYFEEIRSQVRGDGLSSVKLWQNLADLISRLPRNEYPHKLPANGRRLKSKYDLFVNDGYPSLIHKMYGQKNAEKLNERSKFWILARWSNQIEKCPSIEQLHTEYNIKAEKEGWDFLKDPETLRLFLYSPGVEHLWKGHRHEELAAKEKFSYSHQTKMPTMRDSLWYSDGTKLNFYYLDDNGNISTCQVYEVMDAYSEVLLGYHISKTENYEAHFNAYRMAINISGQKPYQIGFDGQGGHKKLKSGSFFDKVSRFAIKTEPYNGKSKTIESAFGRFQMKYLKTKWFFTGQNITAKREESKTNHDVIEKNKANLPTFNELVEIYEDLRSQWNNAPHHATKIPRAEMYRNSENPACEPISIWEMIDLFWITREKPVTVKHHGILFKEKGEEQHYMVTLDDMQTPDIEWLRNNVGRKVWIKYDPSDLTLIKLFEKDALGFRYIAEARPKVTIHRGLQEQEDWEREFIETVKAENTRVRVETRDFTEQVLKDHGMHAEDYGLNGTVIKGVETGKSKTKKRKVNKTQDVKKQESNMVVMPGEDASNKTIYDLM